jgi:hypothetical protein
MEIDVKASPIAIVHLERAARLELESQQAEEQTER